MPTLKLSRLSMFGITITYQTPLCVITEILDSHGISYSKTLLNDYNYLNQCLQTLNKTIVPEITIPLSKPNEYPLVARFINKCETFTYSSLCKALNFMINHSTVELNPDNLITGLPTKYCPFNISNCMLYTRCLTKGMKTFINTSTEDMRNFLITGLKSRSAILSNIIANLDFLDDNQLVQISISIPYQLGINKQINKVNLPCVTKLDKNSIPTDSDTAIALAILNYDIDLTTCRDPISVYNMLSGLPHLKLHFNPYIPRQYYKSDVLYRLCQINCIDRSGMNTADIYEALQTFSLVDSFHTVKAYDLIKPHKSAIIQQDLSDIIDRNSIVRYGNYSSKNNQFFTIDELTSLFNHNRNFSNINGATFSPESISKIEKICLEHKYSKCLDSILEVRLFTATVEGKEKDLLETYRDRKDQKDRKDQRLLIEECLNSLMDLSMYMRGWLGKPHQLPLGDNRPSSTNADNINLLVCQEIIRFDKLNAQLTNLISSLPLLTYTSGKFHASTEINNGLTIGQRIDIVKQGNNTNNMASCIRLSSNWLLSSAYKYLTVIGKRPSFYIHKVVSIA